jgi:hypothetical protein
MKNIYYVLLILLTTLLSCSSVKNDAQTENLDSSMTNDTIRIANDTLEVIIIMIQGLVLGLRQDLYRNYHSQSYLENKNILWVGEWNRRVLQPFSLQSKPL